MYTQPQMRYGGMAESYDLTRLDATSFENLANALEHFPIRLHRNLMLRSSFGTRKT